MTSLTCKADCEALMSSVLPVAEQILSEHGSLQPFGSTLSSTGQIVQVGAGGADALASGTSSGELAAQFEASFRDGAARGELKATALVIAVSTTAAGESGAQAVVAVRLDHRDGYSVVVSFPYRFSTTGELVIDEPFADEGEHRIFQ